MTYSHSGSYIIHLLLNLLESEVVANDHQMVEMQHIDTADALCHAEKTCRLLNSYCDSEGDSGK